MRKWWFFVRSGYWIGSWIGDVKGLGLRVYGPERCKVTASPAFMVCSFGLMWQHIQGKTMMRLTLALLSPLPSSFQVARSRYLAPASSFNTGPLHSTLWLVPQHYDSSVIIMMPQSSLWFPTHHYDCPLTTMTRDSAAHNYDWLGRSTYLPPRSFPIFPLPSS